MNWLTGVLVLCLCLVLGCEQKQAPATAGNVAVVDMDEIAVATGFDKVLNDQMTQLSQQINAHLQQVQKQIQDQLDAKEKALGESPTQEQRVEFDKLSMQLDQQYRNELNKAQQNTNQAHAAMVGQFRQKLDPIAMAVARDRGFDIVISRTESVMMVAARANITQDVLDRFKSAASMQSMTPQGQPATPGMPSGNMAPVLPNDASNANTPQPGQSDAGNNEQQPDVAMPATPPVQ